MSKKRTMRAAGIALAMLTVLSLVTCEKKYQFWGVNIDSTKLRLEVGETAVLTATFVPPEAFGETLVWSAEPEGVVAVTGSENGTCTVKAVGAGSAAVTVKDTDGKKLRECAVSVYFIPVDTVTLDKTDLALAAGETAVIQAACTAGATDQRVTWQTAPHGVVAITDNGDGSCTVTAQKDGTAVVTATSVDGGKTAECRVGVNYLSNFSFIAAVERAVDSEGNPITIGWSKECDGTVKLTPENLEKIQAVTVLDINGDDLSASERLRNLAGIEWFTGLTYLDCRRNNLDLLDLSKNTGLVYLDCSYNDMQSLNMAGLTKLKELRCDNCGVLSELDVTDCAELELLHCDDNQLQELDVSQNTKLTYLICDNNELLELNVSGLPLETLVCDDNDDMQSLNAGGCTALTRLSCSGNDLREGLDVSGCTALTNLVCSFTYLRELDVSDCTALKTLNCVENSLEVLDVSRNTALESLLCGAAKSTGITLLLAPVQKARWDNEWSKKSWNARGVIPQFVNGNDADVRQGSGTGI